MAKPLIRRLSMLAWAILPLLTVQIVRAQPVPAVDPRVQRVQFGVEARELQLGAIKGEWQVVDKGDDGSVILLNRKALYGSASGTGQGIVREVSQTEQTQAGYQYVSSESRIEFDFAQRRNRVIWTRLFDQAGVQVLNTEGGTPSDWGTTTAGSRSAKLSDSLQALLPSVGNIETLREQSPPWESRSRDNLRYDDVHGLAVGKIFKGWRVMGRQGDQTVILLQRNSTDGYGNGTGKGTFLDVSQNEQTRAGYRYFSSMTRVEFDFAQKRNRVVWTRLYDKDGVQLLNTRGGTPADWDTIAAGSPAARMAESFQPLLKSSKEITPPAGSASAEGGSGTILRYDQVWGLDVGEINGQWRAVDRQNDQTVILFDPTTITGSASDVAQCSDLWVSPVQQSAGRFNYFISQTRTEFDFANNQTRALWVKLMDREGRLVMSTEGTGAYDWTPIEDGTVMARIGSLLSEQLRFNDESNGGSGKSAGTSSGDMLDGGTAITPATRMLSLPNFDLGVGSGAAWVASSRAAMDKEPNWRYATDGSDGPIYVALSSISRLKDGNIVVQALTLHKNARQANGEAYQADLAVWVYQQDGRQAKVVKLYLQDRKLQVVHASALTTDRPFVDVIPDSIIDMVGRIARANVR